MNLNRRTALLGLISALSLGQSGRVSAGPLLDGLADKAAKATEKVGETTGAVIEHAADTVRDTRQDLRDEATPAETRAKLDAMAEDSLRRLFNEYPDSRELFNASAGYAVFDTRKLSYGVSAGFGRGVAVDRKEKQRTYMKMGSAGASISYGIGGFDTQVVIFFQNAAAFKTFIVQGLDTTADAGAMVGDLHDQLTVRFEDGRAVFTLTKKGWKVSAGLSGTKYWPDSELN